MKGYTIRESIDRLEKNAGTSGASSASDVTFDPTSTSLTKTNVQEALAECSDNVDSNVEDIEQLQLDVVAQSAATGVSYDNTSSGATATTVQAAIDEAFTSVSNGKTLVAAAITDKGVTTASDASFATMATNIELIPSGTIVEAGSGSQLQSASTEGIDLVRLTVTKPGTLRFLYGATGITSGGTHVSSSLKKNGVDVSPTVAYDGGSKMFVTPVVPDDVVVLHTGYTGGTARDQYYMYYIETPTT